METNRLVRRRSNTADAAFGLTAGTYDAVGIARMLCTSPCMRKKSGSALVKTTTLTVPDVSTWSIRPTRALMNAPSTRLVGGWSIVTVATPPAIATFSSSSAIHTPATRR